MKMTALFLVLLCTMGGFVAAQVTNSIQTGRATWEMTGVGLHAVHPSLPIGSTPMIRNIATGREVRVTVIGNMSASAERIIDISADAARAIGLEPGGYVAVIFSTNTITSVPLRGGNIAINNHVTQILGASVTVFNHVSIDPYHND
ncbi:MAG: septal ring lytic transglycosylase RlpA family protein [Treponema sp.]|nr:septal ring lytic transglycosylase RlpA family protein [Treponema sp.]